MRGNQKLTAAFNSAHAGIQSAHELIKHLRLAQQIRHPRHSRGEEDPYEKVEPYCSQPTSEFVQKETEDRSKATQDLSRCWMSSKRQGY